MAVGSECFPNLLSLHIITVYVFALLALRSAAIPAQTPNDCKRGANDPTHEFFDISQLRCTPCSQTSQFQTVSADGLRCVCKDGLRLAKNFGGKDIECISCPANQIVSSDGWECIACSTSSTPGTCPSCSDTNNIPVERLLNGNYTVNSQNEPTRACSKCVANTHPDGSKSRCVRCNQILSMIEGQSDCICPTKQMSGGVCFKQATDLVADSSTLYMVKFESMDDAIESAYFKYNIRAAHGMCNTPYQNLTACQILGNLCVMRMYTKDVAISNACGLYLQLGAGGLATATLVQEWPANMPWLYYSESADRVLTDRAITTEFTFPNMRIPIVATSYFLNGSYIGQHSVTGGLLQLCKNTRSMLDAAYTFGTTYEQSCTIPVNDLYDNPEYDLRFYDLYMEYSEGSLKQLFAVPVLLHNYKDSSGTLINQDPDNTKWQLTRRFFLVDRVSGRMDTKTVAEDGSTVQTSSVRAKVLRYPKSLTFVITLQTDTDQGKIFPPYLRVEYAEVKDTDYDTGKSVEVSFKVEYTMDLTNYNNNLAIAMGVMSALAVVYGFVQTWGWSKRAGRIAVDLITLIKFLLYVCGALSNVFFVVIFGAGLWWFIFYKQQTKVVLLIPLFSQESSFIAYVAVAFALKCLEILHMFIIQVTVDIFLIDWERPRGRVVTANDAQNKGQEAPVSIWRTYFIANEWNEIQTTRKINHVFQIFAVILFLHVIGFENLASADPISVFSYSASTYHAPPSRILRFAIGALAYVVIGLVQWIFYTFIYERFIEDKIRQYVDLCSMSNVSLFIMENAQFGYYIHGRSVHGCADTGMREMHSNLKREEEDLCGQRGLLPNTDQQTFQMALPRRLRSQYDKVLMPLSMPATGGAASRVERGQGGGPVVDSETEKKIQAYGIVNRFLQAFIDHSLRDLDYMVKDRMLFEGILGVEFEDSSEKGFFYNDNGHSFDSVLFYGNESTLLLFEVLLFSIVDLMSQNFILAAVITYLADELLMRVRDEMGRKNLAKKTLVDERFLI